MIYEVSGPEIGWKCPKNRPKVRATWCFFEKVLAVCSKSEPPIYLLSQNSAKAPIFGDSRHLVWFPHRSKVFQLQGEAVRLQAKKVLGPNMPKSLKNTTYGHAIGMKFGEKIQKKIFLICCLGMLRGPRKHVVFGLKQILTLISLCLPFLTAVSSCVTGLAGLTFWIWLEMPMA